MQTVLLDVDMGVDDALAIALALNAPELEVVGLTVVSGNVPLEQGTRNAQQLLQLLDREEVPIYMGADKPLVRERVDAVQVHGEKGFGHAKLPAPRTLPVGRAVDYMIDEIQMRPGEIVVVATGPLTNLALVERKSPGILNRARGVVAMGGALWCEGNITASSEYNIFADPHALNELLQAQVNLTLIPLDVTEQLTLMEDEIAAACAKREDGWIHFVRDSTRCVIQYEQTHGGSRGMHLHDPAVPALLIDPALFEMRMLRIDVKTEGASAGQIRVLSENDPGGAFINCAVAVDAVRGMQFLRQRLLVF